jgi:hypothetical protein
MKWKKENREDRFCSFCRLVRYYSDLMFRFGFVGTIDRHGEWYGVEIGGGFLSVVPIRRPI